MPHDFDVGSLKGMGAERLVLDRGGQNLVQGKKGWKGHLSAFFKFTSVAKQNGAVWNKFNNAIKDTYKEYGEDIAKDIISKFDTSKALSSRRAVKILESARMRKDHFGLWGQSSTKKAIAQVLQSDQPILLSDTTDTQHREIMESAFGFSQNLEKNQETAKKRMDSDAFWQQLDVRQPIPEKTVNAMKQAIMDMLGAGAEFKEAEMSDSDIKAKMLENVRDSDALKEYTYHRTGKNYVINGESYVREKKLRTGKSGALVLLMKDAGNGDRKCVFKNGEQMAWDGQVGKVGLKGEKDFYLKIGEHPNIVRLYDFVEADVHRSEEGGGGMLLEFVPGKDLNDLQESLNKDKNKSDVMLAKKFLAKQCLAGLKHINAKGMAMHDFDDYNCRVREDGVLKLYDFDMGKELKDLKDNPTIDIKKFVAMLSSTKYFGNDPSIKKKLTVANTARNFQELEQICGDFLTLSGPEQATAKALIEKLV